MDSAIAFFVFGVKFMNEVTFVTGNIGKFEIAKHIFSEFGVELLCEKIETPEIQSMDIEEVAKFSAQYAADKLQKPVMVTDVGHYITSLKGFPGAFIKYINQTLEAENILAMLEGRADREVILKECLAYAEPNKEPVTFTQELKAMLAVKAEGEGSTIDKILILDGFDKPKGAYAPEVSLDYFKRNLDFYNQAAKYIGGIE